MPGNHTSKRMTGDPVFGIYFFDSSVLSPAERG
jgi:hypothetical protein